MKRLSSPIRLMVRAMEGALLLLLVVLAFLGSLRWAAVSAVQQAVVRSYGLTLNEDRIPRIVPQFVADGLGAALEWRARNPDEDEWRRRSYQNRTFEDRVLSLFRGPIRSISVYDVEGFDVTLGPAITRFPQLEALEVYQEAGGIWDEATQRTTGAKDPAAVKALLTALPELKYLKSVTLGNDWIGDEEVELLAALPNIEKLEFCSTLITQRSVAVLARMPKLRELDLRETNLTPEGFSELRRLRPDILLNGGSSLGQ